MAFSDIAQPTTQKERRALARRMCDEMSIPGELLVDSMDDASRALFGDLPTPAIIIDADGIVHTKLPWADPDVLGPRLEKLLSAERPPATTTRTELIGALVAFYSGDADDAAGRLTTLLDQGQVPRDLRPLALRIRAACHPKAGAARAEGCRAAAAAARKILQGRRLDAALSEIAALAPPPKRR